MRSHGTPEVRVARVNGASRELGPPSAPLAEALEDVAGAARRVVSDQLELLVLELRDTGRQWVGALALARIALPLAGLSWFAAVAALAVVLARRYDWPAAFLAVSLLNLVAAGALGGTARRMLNRARSRA